MFKMREIQAVRRRLYKIQELYVNAPKSFNLVAEESVTNVKPIS